MAAQDDGLEQDTDTAENRKKIWAQRIEMLRRRLGLSREDFAAGIGATESSVQRWENGIVLPQGDALVQMLELAKKIGYVWQFTGATLDEIYEDMFNDAELLPKNGLLLFLKIKYDEAGNFIDVINKIARHKAAFHRMGSPGAEAFVLFELEDYGSMERLEADLKALDYVHEFSLKAKPSGIIKTEYIRTGPAG